jgi:uncharacterized protein YjbI with pentapeptide repeats
LNDLLKLLKAGDVDGFNAARGRRGALDLFAADLSEVKAIGVDLSAANLQKADLTDADFTDSVLARANLSGADVSGAQLAGALALQSKWREAYIEDTDFTDADLSASDLSDAELTNVTFENASMNAAKLKRTTLTNCNLQNADLTEARMSDAVLTECDMTGALLTDAKLHGIQGPGLKLAGADLTRARFGGASLVGADLTDAKLVEADLSGVDLTGATLDGANLTRADLSEANLEGASLEGTVLTDAQVDGPLLDRAIGPIPAVTELLVEDPILAAGGGGIAVMWENPTGLAGRPWLRVAAGKRGKTKGPARPPEALPLPTELVVARALAPNPGGGFFVLAMVERPTGVVCNVFVVGLDGAIGAGRRITVPYTPAARPILQVQGDDLLLYGISREGPGLHVHRITDEKDPEMLHVSLMKTVRGFVSDHHPVVLSKGGVLVYLGRRGPGQPMTAPSEFPGRRCGAAPHEKGLALAWLSSAHLGFGIAKVESGVASEERTLLRKTPIGSLDVAADDKGAWAVFTKEPGDTVGAASAWGISLPDGEPFPILDDPDQDVTEVSLVADPAGCLAAVTTLDGVLELYSLNGGKPERVWRLG